MKLRWPWQRHAIPTHELEKSRRALEQAEASKARTRRVANRTREAIRGNHFASDIRKAMEGR